MLLHPTIGIRAKPLGLSFLTSQRRKIQKMAQQTNHIAKEHSINRPPYFNGEDCPYWKDRKRLFIESKALICGKSLRMVTLFQLLSNQCLKWLLI